MESRLVELISFCSKYYPKKKFDHAIRVADYAYHMAKTVINVKEYEAYYVGLAHDLIEDTDCPHDELEKILGTDMFSSVVTLTHFKENGTYEDYIHSILNSNDPVAILVKKADMKDHLMQTETLTDKLKDKYFPVIGLLL